MSGGASDDGGRDADVKTSPPPTQQQQQQQAETTMMKKKEARAFHGSHKEPPMWLWLVAGYWLQLLPYSLLNRQVRKSLKVLTNVLHYYSTTPAVLTYLFYWLQLLNCRPSCTITREHIFMLSFYSRCSLMRFFTGRFMPRLVSPRTCAPSSSSSPSSPLAQ